MLQINGQIFCHLKCGFFKKSSHFFYCCTQQNVQLIKEMTFKEIHILACIFLLNANLKGVFQKLLLEAVCVSFFKNWFRYNPKSLNIEILISTVQLLNIELVSKELNHLAAILHVNTPGV